MTTEQKAWALLIVVAQLTPFLGYLVIRLRTRARETKDAIRALQADWERAWALNQDVVALARQVGATITMSPPEDTYRSWVDSK